MERAITGFHPDEVGDWVAELECGHNQHVRHRPPFLERAWVTTDDGRATRIGATLECPLCDRAELPDALRLVRSTPAFDAETMPAGLRRDHRVAAGTWGRIVVDDGRLSFTARTSPPIEALLDKGSVQAIPPEVVHAVEPQGDVRFRIEFLTVDRGGGDEPPLAQASTLVEGEEGGDPACWVDMVCPVCGGIGEAGHRPDCDAGR